MTTEADLNYAFEKAANDLAGFTATADFAPFRDLKVTWERTIDKAGFHVSDYLKDAPEDILEDLARTIIKRINGEEDMQYPKSLIDYLTSAEIREKNVDTYVSRSRTISESKGMYKNLWESLERLVEKGLVQMPEGLRLYWSIRPTRETSGQTSKIMRVIIMNSMLDSEDVPDFVLDYCLLHQLGFIVSSVECEDWMRAMEFVDRFDEKFDMKEEAETWLEDHGIRL
ncbi:MAG: hypothetical protein RBR71_11555 [Gudongella sp.]|nr:hypothetical protein [Gudongella sp.]